MISRRWWIFAILRASLKAAELRIGTGADARAVERDDPVRSRSAVLQR
jgi:hypothetical protein